MLAVIETHPIQYHAALYRLLQQRFGVPVTAIYASDVSVRGYRDGQFGAEFAGDTDLLSGYTSRFLTSVGSGGPDRPEAASVAGLRAALTEIAPSAVFISGYGFAFHRRAWLEAWRRGHPILFRGETTDVPQDRNWAKEVARGMALRVAYRSCARLLYIGQQSHAHYRRLGIPESRLVFSPYCVDTAPFETSEAARDRLRPAARQALGIGDDRFVLLFSGKLSDRKGVDLLIDAARALPNQLRRRVVLVFVGQGERREALVATACLPPAVDVRFAGFQNPSALSRFYHAADLLVLPSRTAETWGLVVNEALHHGLPCVVSSRLGCGPDLIQPERTGTCAPTGSAAELAAAIASACALAGRREIRDACRERAAQYGLEPAAAGIARAYQAVVAVGAGAPSYAR